MHQDHLRNRSAPAGDSRRRLVEDGTLSIRVSRDNGVLSLEVFGEVDLANADTLDAELVRAEGSDARQIVLDLGSVDFIGSTGLRVLLLATRRSALDSDRLGIVRGTGEVSRVLALTGVDEALKLLD